MERRRRSKLISEAKENPLLCGAFILLLSFPTISGSNSSSSSISSTSTPVARPQSPCSDAWREFDETRHSDLQEVCDLTEGETASTTSVVSSLSSRRRRRYLSGPGSFPPRCTSKCGKCTPCKPVHVPVPPGTPVTAEYYPEAWRCKCGNNLFMP